MSDRDTLPAMLPATLPTTLPTTLPPHCPPRRAARCVAIGGWLRCAALCCLLPMSPVALLVMLTLGGCMSCSGVLLPTLPTAAALLVALLSGWLRCATLCCCCPVSPVRCSSCRHRVVACLAAVCCCLPRRRCHTAHHVAIRWLRCATLCCCCPCCQHTACHIDIRWLHVLRQCAAARLATSCAARHVAIRQLRVVRWCAAVCTTTAALLVVLPLCGCHCRGGCHWVVPAQSDR